MSTEAVTAELPARVAAFVETVVRPSAAAAAAGRGPRPRHYVAEAGRAGLAGLLVPREYGGAGAGHAAFADLIEAVARVDASASVVLDVHGSVGTEPLVLFGDADQRARWLPGLAAGTSVGAFALTEPGHGSDAAGLEARAEPVAGGYRLTGTKVFITNAGEADLYLVMARTGGPGATGVSAFVVEADMPGVTMGRPLAKLGLRGSATAEVSLDGVLVPASHLLGGEGAGFRVAMAALDSGRIGISAQATGIAQGALDVAVEHLRGHHNHPDQCTELADMAATVTASRLLTRHAATMLDRGQPVTLAAAVAKLVSCDGCVSVAHRAFDLCAPGSHLEGHRAAIRLRDAKACQIYEGTNQVQRVVIARELLARDAMAR